ncbi:MAG: asparaginase [Bacteroidales bacterium]|nr:asparaginase [Bacteroidales bacterium]
MTHNKVLIVYTGGTIGMVQDENGSLHPFALDRIYDAVPQLRACDYGIDSVTLDNIIDSSNMTPSLWVDIASIIEREYDHYDGFVVLHGTDTMAYTASALSFMFAHLNKPVVLTGSQLPLGMLRSDGRENIICALEIASTRLALVPEVCIFFMSHLYRGNRSTKISAENFDAFQTFNYPSLARVGIEFSFKEHLFLPTDRQPLQVNKQFERRVAVLKLFPGIGPEVVNALLETPGLQGVVMETYGSGNAPTDAWFIEALEHAIERGVTVMSVTQCKAGAVKMRQYAASCDLDRIGVVGGGDMTIEAAVTKMMYVLGTHHGEPEVVRHLLETPLRGEMSMG